MSRYTQAILGGGGGSSDNYIVGDVQLDKILKDLPNKIGVNSYRAAARKGGVILKEYARNMIPADGPFEHMGYIKRGIKVITLKNKTNPGIWIGVKGPDVPVGDGKSRRFWDLPKYAKLVFFGSYNRNPNRMTKTKGKRGRVSGIGNVFLKTTRGVGKQSRQIMAANLLPEIEKQIKK